MTRLPPHHRPAGSLRPPRSLVAPLVNSEILGSGRVRDQYNKELHAGRDVLGFLLRLSSLIDGLNERVGRVIYWLVLAAVLVSSGNATIRYTFDTSSNAWLELQWYLFSAVFILCAGYTLLNNQHIRIDILNSRFPKPV